MRLVLLIDDDPALLRAFGRVLRGSDTGVVATGSTAAATYLLDTTTFDLVVANFELAGPSALWLLRLVRVRHEPTRRVILSHRRVEGLEAPLAEGLVHTFVEKQGDPKALVAAVLGRAW